MAWSDSPLNPKNWGGGSSSGSSISSAQDAIGPSGNVSLDAIASAPKNSALDDLQMDLGLKPKNAAYYRDLDERSSKSQAMMEQAMRSSDDGPSQQTTPAEEKEAAEEATSGTPTVDELISELEELSKQTFGGEFDPSFVSGPAEEEAMEFEEKGRKSTIKTSAQGIVDAPKKKKSLLAGA